MRLLTDAEISILEKQHCSSTQWKDIEVAENFSPIPIFNVHFSGKISLGIFEKTIKLAGGIIKHTGISNAIIHNCSIGNNVYINKINNHVANYNIEDDCYIENVNLLTVEGKTSFGNGTEVSVLNEAGGREVKIFDKLSSHVAYILALYRHQPALIEKINTLIDDYIHRQTSSVGTIGTGTHIINSGTIKNVKIGNYCTIENAAELYDGTISSSEISPTYIGIGVIARHFIIGIGSKVYDNVLIDKCFVGESCEISKQYSAIDSLFFCNSQIFHGEATAIFAGPYTTTHHKSTLLIGCMFSFYNAGSGTNQSNHMYKLGPVHQGIFERGVKTASDSYVMLEAKVGAFSLVMGHHEQHFDTSDLPFSYILSNDNRSTLIPAVNLHTVGTQRDAEKWQKRDDRKGNNQLDHIIFDLLNPYTIQKIKNGIEILNGFGKRSSEFHFHKSIRIKDIFVSKGISIYQSAIDCYLGQKLTEKLFDTGFDKNQLKPKTDVGKTEWLDVSGLIAPKDLIESFLADIVNGSKTNIEEINTTFKNIYTNYSDYEWNFVYHLLEERIGKPFAKIEKNDIVLFLDEYANNLIVLTNAIVADAEKEFNDASMVSFGTDGDKDTQQNDFENVRGKYAENDFVVEIQANANAELEKIKVVNDKL
jgi:hypothetical protein